MDDKNRCACCLRTEEDWVNTFRAWNDENGEPVGMPVPRVIQMRYCYICSDCALYARNIYDGKSLTTYPKKRRK